MFKYELNLTDEQLSEVTRLASLLTPPSEIACLLGVSEDIFKSCIRRHDHPLRIAYLKGYSSTMQKLRKNQIDVAEAGSPMAVATCRQFCTEISYDLDDI